MADNFTIKIQGLDRAIRQLNKLGGNATKEIAKTLFDEMEEVAGDSKENFVPVDLGNLKNSIHATLPKVRRGGVSVSVVAGGVAAPYALAVHENLRARHEVGQAKFLEQPFLEALPKMERAVRKALDAAIKKARR